VGTARDGQHVFVKLPPVKRMTQAFPDFKLRLKAMLFQGLAAWLGYQAYIYDWLCVSEIQLQTRGAKLDVLDAWALELMGTCGRPSGVGVIELYSCWVLVFSTFIQLLLATSGRGEQVVWIVNKLAKDVETKLQDHHAGGGEDYVSSYVWVTQSASTSDPVVCDCRASGDRRLWKRSREPVKVRLLDRSECSFDWKIEQGLLMQGLDQYVFVEIPHSRGLQQLVPKCFIHGVAMCEVSLGSRDAYAHVYNILTFFVLAFTLSDVAIVFRSNKRLSGCQEVIVGSCASIDDADIQFRPSVGPVLAGLCFLLTLGGFLCVCQAECLLAEAHTSKADRPPPRPPVTLQQVREAPERPGAAPSRSSRLRWLGPCRRRCAPCARRRRSADGQEPLLRGASGPTSAGSGSPA